MKNLPLRLPAALVLIAALPLAAACSDAASDLNELDLPLGSGGQASTGGAPPASSGGATSTGGSSASGGTSSTGGSTASGGASGGLSSGGASSGGFVSSGGASSGGASSGGASTGGGSASGGASSGGANSGGSFSSGGTGSGGTPPASGGASTNPFANFKPKADQPKECPPTAPENPFGDCLGKPIYLGCGWSDGTRQYNCTCDWYHWICL